MESRAYSYKDPLEAFFEKFPEMEIKQDIQGDPAAGKFRNWLKYTSYEIPHKYIVSCKRERIGLITEQHKGGIPFSLKSAFLGGHRPCRLEVEDEAGNVILSFQRPFYLLFSKMIVRDQKGRLRGFIRQKSWFTYELFTTVPRPFGFVRHPVGVAWTVPVLDGQKKQIGEIKKKWGGAARELLTMADTFTVKWGGLSLEQKIVLFAVAVCIDFDWFERS